MKIAVPKEIKVHEYRVGLVPGGAAQLIADGHEVFVQTSAGVGSGIPDEAYEAVGCTIVATADEAWALGDMIVKVKEPIAEEYSRIRRGQILYTYFHLAAVPELARVLVEREATAVAYETIQTPDGRLPLLQPMSEVAGRMAVQVGARCLEKEYGGRGVLLGGIPGVAQGKVVILGGGTVGTEAAKIAIGMGARVTVLDVNMARLRYLDDVFGNRLQTIYSNPQTILEEIVDADLVVGAVLIPGARAPHLVKEAHLTEMLPGAVVVDVSVDQGGCIETCRPTTHDNPTYSIHDVVHYCVANMPGAVARTSTYGLTNVTLSYGRKLAGLGFAAAVRSDSALALGVNTHAGHVTYEAVARDLGMGYRPLDALL
ncbi:MAG: alanine dehydrogenase [Myxococcales bacterium]|nr:alanine dehydrogenase [Myxococcales bacterium]MCB9532659.1 alanine dehydrogenase [Myxococcales bacterium]